MNRILLLTIAIFLGCALQAQAHAFLDHADPKVGGTVTASPATVKIWFTMDVKPALSQIAVYDVTGKQLDKKDTKPDPGDKSVLSVSLPPLPPGAYKVEWHAVCPFGHPTSGTYSFNVADR